MRKSNSGQSVRVSFTPNWECPYLHIIDCMLPYFAVASVLPDPTGSFSITVPDFASDPVLAELNTPADDFSFHIEDESHVMLGWGDCPYVPFKRLLPRHLELDRWASSGRQVPETCQ
jgi:hypothetical protein